MPTTQTSSSRIRVVVGPAKAQAGAMEVIDKLRGAPVTAVVVGLIVLFWVMGNLSSTAADELALVPAK